MVLFFWIYFSAGFLVSMCVFCLIFFLFFTGLCLKCRDLLLCLELFLVPSQFVLRMTVVSKKVKQALSSVYGNHKSSSISLPGSLQCTHMFRNYLVTEPCLLKKSSQLRTIKKNSFASNDFIITVMNYTCHKKLSGYWKTLMKISCCFEFALTTQGTVWEFYPRSSFEMIYGRKTVLRIIYILEKGRCHQFPSLLTELFLKANNTGLGTAGID